MKNMELQEAKKLLKEGYKVIATVNGYILFKSGTGEQKISGECLNNLISGGIINAATLLLTKHGKEVI